MSGRVELSADRGRSALDQQFFRSAQFCRAERVTHSLRLSGPTGVVVLPLVVRPIPGTDLLDAASPYGYPAGRLEGHPLTVADLDLSGTGLVSVFLRDRVDHPVLENGTLRPPVYLFDPARDNAVGATFRKHVRRNERRGLTVGITSGPDVTDAVLHEFTDVYHQTMARTGAQARYRFSSAYLRECLDHPGSRLISAREPDGAMAAASLVVESDGMLHYFLEGADGSGRTSSPGKNCVDRALGLAAEVGQRLNFGGGLEPGDGIARFKQTFCNAVGSFTTHEIVVDPAAYALLSGGAAADTGFFPAYRDPAGPAPSRRPREAREDSPAR